MNHTDRAPKRAAAYARLTAIRRKLGARLARAPQVESPPEKPFIASAEEWPPPPAQPIDIDEFALLSPASRAAIVAILEPALVRLNAAALDAMQAMPAGTSGAATRAIAGRIREIAGLIEAIDAYNDTPESRYRIAPRLKSFLVECAVVEVGDGLRETEPPGAAPIAA